MPINRRRFMLDSLGSVIAAPPILSMLMNPDESHASPSPDAKPYGSGHFGEWIEDEFALPAYRYTCDQTIDPKAVTSVTPGILAPNEHIHQVGNDRIIAIASNNGTVRVRQDEGAPKFLNDYDPASAQFGGGIGYLTGGSETLSTFYSSSNNGAFERIFGIGYFRKRVAGKSFHLDQIISAPFGDDPVLLSEVTITNHGSAPADLRWIEYWGCQNYQFSFRSFIESFSQRRKAVDLRRKFSQRFKSGTRAIDGNTGLIESKEFLGRAPEDDMLWKRMKAMLANGENTFISPIPEETSTSSFDDLHPPSTFLISLDGPADGFSANGDAFFATGGAQRPSGLAARLDGELTAPDGKAALLIERAFHLNPGHSKTLRFLYGYLPAGVELDPLVARYKSTAATALKDSSSQWKSKGMRFSIASEPWVAREIIWNHYCLRSSLTYDDFFQQHLLNQNGFYQYSMGFQGAARDPLQHCLPFIFSDPEIVKSILRYTLKEVRADGSVPYAITGHGLIAPMVADNASDLPLWLLWTASEYVLATRDLAFLDQQIPSPLSATPAKTDSVLNLLARCYRHQVDQVGVGEHGIARMLNDDWNDGLLGTFAGKDFKQAAEKGESVLNSAMSAWVFDYYASMLNFAGRDLDTIPQIRAAAATNREAASKQWTGKWFRRAWLGPMLGWLGEDTLWIEPQPWAIVAGVATPAQSRELIATMDTLLRRISPIGAAQMSQGPDMAKGALFEPGTCVNGGIWPSLNQTLIWALATVDPAMAWDEWKKNSFARHADAYPDIWYGIWSGTDSYNSTVNKLAGETVNNIYFHGTDFPVLNLHSHACSLYSSTKLFALEFTEKGFAISPDLPGESYRFESPLIGVIKSNNGSFEGWYAPAQQGTWSIQVTLPEPTMQRLNKAEVNGAPVPLNRIVANTLELTGKSEPGKPLRWRIQ